MPYTKSRITRPLPRPLARVPWRRSVKDVGGAGTTLPALLGPYNFLARVYVAWDPPTTANPAWLEVTGFVQVDPGIEITRGRPDGESDPQVGTATMTVDNSDGRWSPTNPNGAWFGQIRKGCWLRVDLLPPSGVVSTRFVGFVQQLPVSWAGRYSMVQISASDRFVLLGNAPAYQSAIVHEWLSDPVGAQYIAGYWPLHEPASAAYASDVSGNAPANQSTLAVGEYAVNPGNGVAFANVGAPGYDGLSTVTFTPIGSPILGSGARPYGGFLQGTVGPNGNVSQITVWVNTTVMNQPFLSWADGTSNYAFGIGVDPNGYGLFYQASLSGVTSGVTPEFVGSLGRYPIADGTWHQVSLKLQTAAATASTYDEAYVEVSIDGISVFGNLYGNNPASTVAPPATLTRLTVGAGEGFTAWEGYAGLGMFTGSLSDLVIHTLPSSTLNVDFYGPYQAGTAMWQSPNYAYPVAESCGRRIIRLAQYAGVPVSTMSFVLPNFGTLPAYDVTPGVTPFINIPAETAHPAGLQQLQGAQPLAAMQTAAHTENMPLFVDRQGRIVLQPSTLRQNPTPAFSINALDLDPSTQWADDFQYLQNQTVITPSGQGSLTVNTNGTASQALNGLYSDGLDTITINPLESGSLGAAINGAGANPAPRHNPLACEVATLATQPGYGNTWYDAVLAADISSVIQVANWPSQSPGGSSGSYYIEGYTETITAGNHLIAWNTSPAQGPTYQLDSPTLGLLDTPGITLAY
jgi:hypothetical protein